MKLTRLVIPVVAGVAVFGAVTAFAATLNVTSTSLASGNATVAACNSGATITYNVAYNTTTTAGYKVTTSPITSAAACATMAYRATLTGATGSLGEVTGSLSATGTASPDFTSANVLASAVTGVTISITG